MPSVNTHQTRLAMKWLTMSLGVLSLIIVVYGFASQNQNNLEGRLLPKRMQNTTQWKTISAAQVLSGTTVQANTMTIIHMPEEITRISRRVLFGRKGETVRYWGYCFPPDQVRAQVNARRGLPGDLFLSEAEREHRKQILIAQRRRTFSIYKHLTADDLNETRTKAKSLITHKLEMIEGGTDCAIMSQKPIPIGADIDGDQLNSALERAYGADPRNPDTDGDGITDGLEVLRGTRTHPTKRDSDGDRIHDGIEDANRNGRYDVGETNAMAWDTDRDGLCDGLCKVNKGLDIRGEDKNLNGIYEPDKNEYDPRSVDSDNNGVLDEHEVYLCIINGGDDC